MGPSHTYAKRANEILTMMAGEDEDWDPNATGYIMPSYEQMGS